MFAPYTDPRDYGANCDFCVMRKWGVGGPVPAEIGDEARIAVVGMEPGEDEVNEGRPFVGQSWRTMKEHGLEPAGLRREELAICNVRDCRPPGNKYGLIEARLRKLNAARLVEGRPVLPTPTECCRPKLARLLAEYSCIVPLGSDALKAVLGTRGGIIENRGAMFETMNFGRAALVLPTYHPSYVARNGRWAWPFKQDWRRAVRYFNRTLTWTPPVECFMPTVEQVREYLGRGARRLVYDVETDGLEPLTARLRCVGIGDSAGGIVIPWLGIDGHTRFYTDQDYAALRVILREWFTSPKCKKIGHNCGSYDKMVIEQHFGVTPAPIIDTLILHRLGAFAEFPHTLGFVGSTLTDVRAWKAGKIASKPSCDLELWRYNLTDCVVNARIAEPCARQVVQSGQLSVAKIDAAMQSICCGMHRLGEFIDQGVDRHGKMREWPIKRDRKTGAVVVDKESGKPVRDESQFGRLHWEVKLTEERDSAISEVRGLLGDSSFDPGNDDEDFRDSETGIFASDEKEAVDSFNPVSPKQLRELLYDRFKLPVLETTKESGDASTGDGCLRKLIVDPCTPEYPRKVLKAVRRVRAKTKLLGLVRSYRDAPGEKGCCLSWDHNLHAHWNASGKGSGDDGSAVSGRLTSSPNCFSADTEILTDRGWFRFDNLPRGVPVAQWNAGRVEFVTPTAYQEFPAASIRRVENEHISLAVTADHRCLLRQRKTGALRVFSAVEYPDDWQQIQAGTYVGPGLDLLPGELETLVAVQADGRIIPGVTGEYGGALVTLTFDKHRKIERMREILRKSPAVWDETDREGCGHSGRSCFNLRACEFTRRIIARLGYAKLFGPWIFQLSREQLTAFCEEVFHWDGCFTRRNHYSSSVEVNADWVQIAFSLSGVRARKRIYLSTTGRPNYQIDVTRRDYSLTTNVVKTEEKYTGNVYCVSVPSSFIVVRRGANVMVTGQCQNVKRMLRSMLIADPDAPFRDSREDPAYVFVDADMDALEARYLVALSRCEKYLEVFERARRLPPNHPDGDPHRTTMIMVHGEAMVRAFSGQPVCFNGIWDKGSKDYAKSRDLNKRIYYAGQYGADAPTVHDVILAATNAKGELQYTDLPLRRTRRMLANWRKGVPEIVEWWHLQMALFAAQGYLAEAIAGRRRYFLDGAQPKASGIDSHLINFPVQCVPGWTRVITDRGYLPIAELEGCAFSAWTGKRWAPAVGVRKGTAALFRIRTNRGADFYCDSTHRFYVVGRDGYEWRRADELSPNTRIALPLARGLNFGVEGDEESAYMIGLWTADGSTSESSESEKCLSFAVRKEDRDDARGGKILIDRISSWIESSGMTVSTDVSASVVNIRTYVGGVSWLLSWGVDEAWKAHTKRIPALIWRSSLAVRRAFLRGFLDGDGHHEEDGAATVNLCQRELCEELILLARTAGIDGRLAGPYDTGDGEHVSYRAIFSGAMVWESLQWGAPAKLHTATAPWREAARVLPDLCPVTRSDYVIVSRIRCGRKQTASPYVLSRMGGRDLFDHAVVSSVTPRGVVVPVYTLMVDDPDHAYVADGIISHNSGAAGIVNNSTIKIVTAIPFDFRTGTGLVGQYHDALKIRCRRQDAREVGDVLRREMSGEWLAGMLFTASPSTGLRGSEV